MRRSHLAALLLFLSALCAFAPCGAALAAQVPQGPPAAPPQRTPAKIVRAIEVQGAQRYTKDQLLQALGQEIGEPYDELRVNRGIETLMKAFKVRARLQARPRPDGMELLLIVYEEPFDLEPRFAGNRDIDLETLRRWAHLDEKGELYKYQSQRVRQRLLEGYHQEGYAFVEIDVQERDTSGTGGQGTDVIFEIREGPQVRVQEVLIEGNRSLPETGALWWKNGLVHLAKTDLEGPWLFNLRGSKYVEETLQADMIAMRNVYRDLGWLDAVVEAEPLEFTPDRSGVRIRIHVDEGEPYVISKLSFRGVQRAMPNGAHDLDEATESEVPLLFDEKQLRALCKLAPGLAYQRARQQADAAALRKFYGQHGYLGHPSLDPLSRFEVLDPELIFDKQGHKVEVTYKLQQGIQRFIREVLFSGSEFTRDRVLRREVDVRPGEVADAEEINRSLNRIFGTNYFSDEMSQGEHREPTYRFVTLDTDPKWLDLVYAVQEGRVVDFNLSGGVDSNNGLVAHLNLQMRNFDATSMPSSLGSTFSELYDKEAFHGAGQTLQLDFSPGTITTQGLVRFVEPDLFGTQLDRYGLDVSASKKRQTWDFYTEYRDSVNVRISREFGRNLRLSGGVTAQELNITDIKVPLSGIHPPDEPQIPPTLLAEAGRSALNGFTFDLLYQQVDNRINPYEGLGINWRNALYGGVLAGDWNFWRSQFDIDAYFILGHHEEEQSHPGFHASLGLGLSAPMDGTADVPYSERFFLGGLKNLRGFKFHGVGPNTGGEPDGGQTMLNGSLEYRIPLSTQTEPGSYKEREVFRLLLFADAGILDQESFTLHASELRTSVGFGIGMAYPLPIHLYFGFPIRSGEGDQRQTFGFNIAAFGF